VVKCKRSTEELNIYLRSQLLGTGEIQIAIDDGELYTSVDNMEKGLKERYETLCKKSNDILWEHIINNLHKVHRKTYSRSGAGYSEYSSDGRL